MKNITLRNTICCLFVIFVIISCTKENNITATEAPKLENGYPVNLQEVDSSSSYPDPVNVQINLEDIIIPDAPDPVSKMGSLSAVLYSPLLSQIIPDTSFYLMPAIGENNNVPPIIAGPDTNQGDIHGFSDNNGSIVLNNITPDNYYLVVWSPYDWVLAEDNDHKPLLIEIKRDSKNRLDIISVPWQ